MDFPFRLQSVFFSSLNFSRNPVLPEDFKMEISLETKITDKDFPERVQVNLRLKTHENTPINFVIELIGLFEYSSDNPDSDRRHISEYMQDKGFNMLLPYIHQMVRMITSQMGMKPIDIEIPTNFLIQMPGR